jgi:hypothetical protein
VGGGGGGGGGGLGSKLVYNPPGVPRVYYLAPPNCIVYTPPIYSTLHIWPVCTLRLYIFLHSTLLVFHCPNTPSKILPLSRLIIPFPFFLSILYFLLYHIPCLFSLSSPLPNRLLSQSSPSLFSLPFPIFSCLIKVRNETNGIPSRRDSALLRCAHILSSAIVRLFLYFFPFFHRPCRIQKIFLHAKLICLVVP